MLFAADLANKLDLPLLFVEGLNSRHPFASDRINRFILDGVPDNAKRAAALGIGYRFETELLYRRAADAAALVTDDYPGYMVSAHNARVPAKLGIPYYAVEASCIVPIAVIGKQQWAAYAIRPKINRLLSEHLRPLPIVNVHRRWQDDEADRSVARVARNDAARDGEAGSLIGGRHAALKRLDAFLEHDLRRYARENREPSAKATSGLSPYLHFGHLSALEVALAVREHAAEHKLIADEFLEQLIVRRELAFNFARYGPEPRTLAALPDWARATLAKHDGDPRPSIYTREEFEQARTHDALWNAAQLQLLREGTIHGYYRMYWGKKIIEWSASHQEALDTMIYLNDAYALDGRDPNGYTNILWCFGLHDRPWAERPVFGMIRYMSLDGMKRKTNTEAYIQEFSPTTERPF